MVSFVEGAVCSRSFLRDDHALPNNHLRVERCARVMNLFTGVLAFFPGLWPGKFVFVLPADLTTAAVRRRVTQQEHQFLSHFNRRQQIAVSKGNNVTARRECATTSATGPRWPPIASIQYIIVITTTTTHHHAH